MAKTSTDWGLFDSLADTADARNIIGSSQGGAGGGKSHFWLTAPEPIAYFLFDPGGLKGLSNNELFKDKDVRVLDFSKLLDYGRIDKSERTARAIEVMEMFNEAWDTAMAQARTIVIDKEDVLWETTRYAHDEVDSPTPKNFYELNMQHRGLIVQAEAAGINLGLLRGMKETWGKIGVNRTTGKPQMGFTGLFIPRGQKEIPELVQINLEHRWDEADREFKVKILDKCRLGNAVDLMGEEFGMLDFPALGMLLYPESEPGEWE